MRTPNLHDLDQLTSSVKNLSVDTEEVVPFSVADIGFTQRTVSDVFRDGGTLADLTEQLILKKISPASIPPIRVVKYRERWMSLDNRRLRVFKDAFVETIPVVLCDLEDKKISQEFHQKRTNKSIEDGGVPRSVGLPWQESSAHFYDGGYIFTKKVLSWTLEQISMPLSALMHTRDLPITYSADDSYSYYEGFLNLILEEARATLHAGLQTLNKAETVNLRFIKDKLSKNMDNPSTLTFEKKTVTKQPYKSGDMLILTNQKYPELKFIGMIGYLIENPDAVEKRIQVKIIIEEDLIPDYAAASANAPEKWAAQLLGSVITHSRMYDACIQKPNLAFQRQLLTGQLSPLQSQQNRYALLIGYQSNSNSNSSVTIDDSSLNASQRDAAEKFLALKEGIQLVQGPPGTGKTTMTIVLLEELLKLKERVLVCAPSNKAVQVLAERFLTVCPDAPAVLAGVEDRLADDSPLQRIFIHSWGQQLQGELTNLSEWTWNLLKQPNMLGIIRKNFVAIFEKIERYQFSFLSNLRSLETKVDTALKSLDEFFFFCPEPATSETMLLKARVLLSQLSGAFTEISTIISKYAEDDSSNGLEGQLLGHSQVVFSTLSVSGRKSFKEMNSVDVLLVDEAGQSVEAETLIPFVTEPKKCLLIGDTKQLPATVISQEAERLGYGRSLLYRLLEGCQQEYSLLDTQYRMHPDISVWPSKQYYQGRIQNDPSVMSSEHSLVSHKMIPNFIEPYAFIHVEGRQTSDMGHSYVNTVEADYVVRILSYLKKQLGIDVAEKVGVITFYKGQANYLQNKIKSYPAYANYTNVKVQTVDSFQGSENDIIIISFVRSNDQNRIGFLKEFRRLNVALTRAKSSLIMLGDAETLSGEEGDLAALICDSKQRQCFFKGETIKRAMQRPAVTKNPFKKPPSTRPFKTKPCMFFNGQPNSCRYGEMCTFLHSNFKR